jgi:hypothetical protein
VLFGSLLVVLWGDHEMKTSASRISSLMMTNAVTLVTFFVVMLSLDAIGTLVEAQEVAICGGFVSTSSALK